ncbi:hypothetical protein JB92DRAFT_2929424 [Gautieria morchelliformis]|nr:hypothetical protein JB92DRAFT_2929424 [Gautieria morchelliformis]
MGTTVEQIESYFFSVEEFLSSSLTSVAPDLPHLHEIANRIWADITRFGPPSLPQLPGLGSFEVPPSPPLPPPPPPTWSESLGDWAGEHKGTIVGASVGLVGFGLLAGYGVLKYRRDAAIQAKRKDMSKERREVVVVLGADHPFGLPLVLGLEATGYIVIASVSNPDAVDTLEAKSKGYIRVLVLDPREPQTVPYFLRSLQSSLSLRFPANSPGDPYLSSSASPHTRPYIHALVSLLSLIPTPSPAPVESLSLTDSYLPHVIRTHITPLRVIQALLPLLRRGSRFPGEGTTRKSIVVCVPAVAARVGVAFASEEAMSAAATVRAIDVLRRELRASASQNTDDGIVAPRVVLVDVGAVALSRHRPVPPPAYDQGTLMQSWSASEKAAYGAALDATLEQAKAPPRKPTHVSVFVDAIVGTVSDGARGRGYGFGYKSGVSWSSVGRLILSGWGRVRTCVRGDRFSIGAGATTYSLASYLPSTILDYLLHIPHAITSIRNTFIPVDTFIPLATPTMPATHHPQRLIEHVQQSPIQGGKDKEIETESSDAASEADVDSVSASGASESGAIGGSWVSLKDGPAPGSESGKE